MASQSDRSVIFDVDGVLVDSYQSHWLSWSELARQTGVMFTEAEFTASFGQTSRQVLARHWGPDRPPDELAALDSRKEQIFRDLVSTNFPAMPGAVNLIKELSADGWTLAVGSSGPPENVDLVLDRLGCRALLSAIVTGRHVKKGKPDPEVFRIAARRMGASPDHCIVIEDAPVGIEAAARAGMRTVAFLSAGRSRSDFTAHAPQLIVESFSELSSTKLAALLEPSGQAAEIIPRRR